jgi:hypothetical protein
VIKTGTKPGGMNEARLKMDWDVGSIGGFSLGPIVHKIL